MKFQDKLRRMYACSTAVNWVGNKSFATAWDECPYGSWLLFLIGRLRDANCLSNKIWFKADLALHDLNTNLSPPDRIRSVIALSTVQKAVTKYKN